MTPMVRPLLRALALALALPGMAAGALAQQQQTSSRDTGSPSRTEASQIELPLPAGTGAGRAYLDPLGRPATPPMPRASLTQTGGEDISRGSGSAPASQISARGQGGPGMMQLSRSDLDATLAQLSATERRVLLQAIEGSDICDNPPAVPAIIALCQNRLETRSGEFTAQADRPLSAEDRLLRGDFEGDVLPRLDQVIERLARGGASRADPSNQAIASIALGTAPVGAARPEDAGQPGTPGLGEETQALVNALINQLGGRAP